MKTGERGGKQKSKKCKRTKETKTRTLYINDEINLTVEIHFEKKNYI